MSINGRKLKAFIYYLDHDRELVEILKTQLEMEGVESFLSGSAQYFAASQSTEETRGQDPFQRMLAGVDVVLFCLSDWFEDIADLETAEWRKVLNTALQKRQGDLFVIPICLEPCRIPAQLHRWQPVKLYAEAGYEDLMLSLQIRAERLGLELKPHSDWHNNLFSMDNETTAVEEVEEAPRYNLGALVIWTVLALLVLAGVLFVQRLNVISQNQAAQTAQAVSLLMATATQNVAAQGTEHAATITSIAATFDELYLQTQVYITGVAQTATAVMRQAQVTETYTATVFAPPTAIIDPHFNLMLLVPGGLFPMGQAGDADAAPSQILDVRDFYIDQYEVSNARYQECVTAGNCSPPTSPDSQTRLNYFNLPEYANFPVVNVDWNMAKAYCEWRGGRLPTEAEWEKAARGPDGLIHPWGDEPGCIFANHAACLGDTAAVDNYLIGVSVYSIYNLAGNVAEWTSSLLLPYPYNPDDGREEDDASRPHVLRGGSWASPPTDILTYHRVGVSREFTSLQVGFRCARDVFLSP